jgi:hypothetical protein
MKKLIFTVFLILPFVVHSQNFEKTFLTILDEYIKHEPAKRGFGRDSILLYVSFNKINEVKNDYMIGVSMHMFKYYPVIIDSLKTYNGVKMVVRYPKNMRKKLSKHFKSIKDTRKVKEEEVTTIYESVSNFVFQLHKNSEIYIVSTNEDDYYYEKFKVKKLKFSKDFKFMKDLIEGPAPDDDE